MRKGIEEKRREQMKMTINSCKLSESPSQLSESIVRVQPSQAGSVIKGKIPSDSKPWTQVLYQNCLFNSFTVVEFGFM